MHTKESWQAPRFVYLRFVDFCCLAPFENSCCPGLVCCEDTGVTIHRSIFTSTYILEQISSINSRRKYEIEAHRIKHVKDSKHSERLLQPMSWVGGSFTPNWRSVAPGWLGNGIFMSVKTIIRKILAWGA
jgi:hypothetical protein